jgi:DNA-directed RNA polymerase I and III subunit RPAC1
MQKLEVGVEIVGNQASNDLPGHWPGENHDWDLDYFKDVCAYKLAPSLP